MNFYARTLALGYIHISRFVRCVGRGDKDFVGARRKKQQRRRMAKIRAVDRQRSICAIATHDQCAVRMLEMERHYLGIVRSQCLNDRRQGAET